MELTQALLSLCYRDTGRTSQAVAILEQVVRASEQGLGPEHPDTLSARGNLGGSYAAAGRASEAIAGLKRPEFVNLNDAPVLDYY